MPYFSVAASAARKMAFYNLITPAVRRYGLRIFNCRSNNMTVVPFEQEFLLPYGIFYRSNPTPPVRSFLDFIRSTYENGNISGIVPVLQLR